MDLRRLRAGEWILALSGAALVSSLFLPWYGLDVLSEEVRPLVVVSGIELTGWQALSVTDVVACGAGVMAVAVLLVTAWQKTVAVPVALTALTTLVGIVATGFVAVAVIFEPSPGDVGGGLAILESVPGGGVAESAFGTTRMIGAWLGLVAVVGVAAGGWIAVRDERLSRPGRPTDPTGRPVAAPPEVELVPPPRPSE